MCRDEYVFSIIFGTNAYFCRINISQHDQLHKCDVIAKSEIDSRKPRVCLYKLHANNRVLERMAALNTPVAIH